VDGWAVTNNYRPKGLKAGSFWQMDETDIFASQAASCDQVPATQALLLFSRGPALK
jgi:hypothetical protein